MLKRWLFLQAGQSRVKNFSRTGMIYWAPYWDDILGRNKVAIRANAKALFENVDWKSFAHHRVVLFGNYRQEFKDLAKLIGYEVVEEDKLKCS